MQAVATPNAIPRLRPIALPAEHGGWGMLAAPILTGLLIAPSWAGLLLSVAGLSAFLTRQPFRLALTDFRKGKHYPRTAWATGFAGTYALAGLCALIGATLLSRASFGLPFLIAAALGAFQFTYDIQSKGRRFLPEIAGAGALSLLAVAIVEAGGVSTGREWLLALVLALQAATAISYASARVRLARAVAVTTWPIWVGHLTALGIVSMIVCLGWMSWPVIPVFALLNFRALWGLSSYRLGVRAAIVGLQEVGYAALTVVAIVAAFPAR